MGRGEEDKLGGSCGDEEGGVDEQVVLTRKMLENGLEV